MANSRTAATVKTRSTQVYDKYSHLESEVSGLKTDVGSLKIDMSGVRADVRVLNESYHGLERTVVSGFDELKDSVRSIVESKERTTGTIQVNTLIAVIGVVLPTVAMIGGAAMLMLSPIQDNIAEHKLEIRENQASNVEEHKTLARDVQTIAAKIPRIEEQQIQIERFKAEIDRLSANDASSIAERSKLLADIEWLKSTMKENHSK